MVAEGRPRVSEPDRSRSGWSLDCTTTGHIALFKHRAEEGWGHCPGGSECISQTVLKQLCCLLVAALMCSFLFQGLEMSSENINHFLGNSENLHLSFYLLF